VFDQATPASNTRLEEPAMSTATLTAVTLAAAPARSPRPGAPRRPSAGPGGPGLVLTRRGRRLVRAAGFLAATVALAVGLVLLWVGVAATVAPGASAGDGGEGVASGIEVGQPVDTSQVVVGPGDTLWQIAREHAPHRDPRSVVDDIVVLNELSSTGVQAGVTLLVPTG
jgi:nucleoid-associated protein YgaU